MKYLIAGLGNTGKEYAHTRHNIGFDIVNAFVRKHDGNFRVDRLAYVAEIKWKGKIFICICPTTFMNLDKEKISIDRLLVILDDVALPLNKMRIRPGGSSGGHNGLKNIEEVLGTKDYSRLRFGIGNDFPKGQQSNFVLGHWKNEEEPLVKLKIEKAVEGIEGFAVQGITPVMNDINNIEFSL